MKYTEEQLEEIRKEFENSLKHIDGFICVSLGLKEKGDDLIRETCLKVFVEKKIPKKELASGQMIPDSFKGIKTDVMQIPVAQQRADSSKYRPLLGGIQIINNKAASTGGTLGCMAKLKSDGTAVMLSNHHVIFQSNAQIGDKIGQPSHSSCSGCCVCNEVAEVTDGADDPVDGIDCGIAKLKTGINFLPEIKGLNAFKTTGMNMAQITNPKAKGLNTIYGKAAPVRDMVVFKVGRTTGRTVGIITTASAPVDITNDDKTKTRYHNQIHIRNYAGTDKMFLDGGDSGSVLINDDNKIVGLNFASAEEAPYYAFSNDIQRVISKLKIDILYSGTEHSIPILGEQQVIDHEVTTVENLQKLEKQITEAPFGKKIIDAVYEHQPEVMKLINTNREVKVAWNRYQGPAFVAHIIKSGLDENYQIPKVINGVQMQNLLVKMSVALEENGSSRLRNDINRYGLDIMTCLKNCNSINEIKEFIEKENIVEPQP